MIAFCVRSIMMFGLMISSFYIFAKSIQYKAAMSRIILSISWCLIWSLLYGYIAVSALIPLSIVKPLACSASVAFVFFLTRRGIEKQRDIESGQALEVTVSAYLLSFGISYVLNFVSVLFVCFPFMFLFNSDYYAETAIDYSQPIYILIHTFIVILQLVSAVLFFRIKRFKNGFPFIFKKYTIVLSLIFTGIILIFMTRGIMIAQSETDFLDKRFNGYLFVAGVFIIGIGIFLFIRLLVKNYQRMRIRQHSEGQFEKLYLKEKEENERLRKRNDEIEKAKSSALHSIKDKIKALEEAIKKGTATLDDVAALKNAWHDELDKFKEDKKHLQSTKVNGIDILLDYYENQYTDDDIVFELILDGNIKYMVDNVIKQSQFETLITNHLNDAKIAVNASENTYRRVTAIIRFKDDCYEFTVLDSGIPFEVDTLVRLGTERVTTHADTGGSGIGFETTFEIMREYNASLIISEQEESDIDFSKSVTIRFDGKGQYIIETYRPGEFPTSERYIIKGR